MSAVFLYLTAQACLPYGNYIAAIGIFVTDLSNIDLGPPTTQIETFNIEIDVLNTAPNLTVPYENIILHDYANATDYIIDLLENATDYNNDTLSVSWANETYNFL